MYELAREVSNNKVENEPHGIELEKEMQLCKRQCTELESENQRCKTENQRRMSELEKRLEAMERSKVATPVASATPHLASARPSRATHPDGLMLTHLIRQCYGLADNEKIPGLKSNQNRPLLTVIEHDNLLIGATNITRARNGARVIPSSYVAEAMARLKHLVPWITCSGRRYDAV